MNNIFFITLSDGRDIEMIFSFIILCSIFKYLLLNISLLKDLRHFLHKKNDFIMVFCFLLYNNFQLHNTTTVPVISRKYQPLIF